MSGDMSGSVSVGACTVSGRGVGGVVVIDLVVQFVLNEVVVPGWVES